MSVNENQTTTNEKPLTDAEKLLRERAERAGGVAGIISNIGKSMAQSADVGAGGQMIGNIFVPGAQQSPLLYLAQGLTQAEEERAALGDMAEEERVRAKEAIEKKASEARAEAQRRSADFNDFMGRELVKEGIDMRKMDAQTRANVMTALQQAQIDAVKAEQQNNFNEKLQTMRDNAERGKAYDAQVASEIKDINKIIDPRYDDMLSSVNGMIQRSSGGDPVFWGFGASDDWKASIGEADSQLEALRAEGLVPKEVLPKGIKSSDDLQTLAKIIQGLKGRSDAAMRQRRMLATGLANGMNPNVVSYMSRAIGDYQAAQPEINERAVEGK